MTLDWHWKSAREIRDAVQSGAVSALDVTEAYLRRIDAVEDKVDAYTQRWNDTARSMATKVDEKVRRGETAGPLAGVPVALKELLCTRTGKTTCASKMLENFRSPYDATVVRRLEEADAVFLGKVNMDEFAMGSSTENSAIKPTRNPWNLRCVPGGSSGGSAAAVSAGECALSLGSDTGGSIRQPACLCGCVGIKPTYGRVSRYGLVAFASSLDQVGPLTRTVEDAALTLNVICGRDAMDATSADLPVPDFTAALTGDIRGLRIGLPKEYFTDALSDQMREKIEAAIEVFRDHGATIVDVSLPCSEYAIAVYYIICTAEASANLARFDGVRYGFRHPEAKTMQEMYVMSKSAAFGPEVRRRIMLGTYVLSSGYYDAYYLKAQKVRRLIKKDFDAAFEQCDVIAGPTSPTPSFEFGAKSDNPLEMYLSDIYTISVNLATLPGMSVPCGLTEAGLPVGLQLMARPFEEETLLRAAHFYEQNRGFDMGRPPVA
ncbi:MAG: Glutamyl-tRNA(Gln) amidotransferase subunit A [Candidatus Hydrogenedentes bacterium ADurb.Bin101]|jgi:aspartyl-tRNA(Asn)/glutamyl-tRNA(Gln) amidotransferase subunit A|nr:MAG: Glutamyl-tRNA(Gln) amidotransferase subunit A [Candidatus Hydrogenedentes bacterium ADurb.Bin101]HOC68929.1 Asp-tRNA(Asn)/Glu-tRNA(Gln) amidotransferase subunit GatA [Candidatus Hydrogenedentota bacterium]